MVDISKLKFRHLYGELYKKKFENIQPSTSSSESCGIKGNPKFFAFSWKTNGGGALAVFQNKNYQKLSKVPPLITGHQGSILDFDFYPFNDNQIATSSEDCTIKFWQLPDEFVEDINEPIFTLQGHQKKVQLIAFNHISENVLASASADQTIKLWNLAKQTENISISVPDQSWGLQWNITGNLLGLINKDKQWRIMDPRANTIVTTTKAHTGPKNQSKNLKLLKVFCKEFTWVGDQYCLTTGLSKSFERQFSLYDIRKTEKPIQNQNLDNSSGTLFPFFDNDTNILFLAGKGKIKLNCNDFYKGDANIRYYEFSENQLFFCSNFSTTKSGMGYGFYSKRSVDVGIHEIMRGLKLTDSTVEFIKFCAPRKSDVFQDDLFPLTFGPIPSQTSDDFFNNQNNPAILISLNPQKADTQIQSDKVAVHFTEESTVLEQSKEINKDIIILQQKYELLKDENNQLRKKNKEQLIQIEQLEISMKKNQGNQKNHGGEEYNLQEKLENEQEKNRKLQFQINVLQQKTAMLEKSVNQESSGADNKNLINESKKQEFEFIKKLETMIKEREETLKIEMNK